MDMESGVGENWMKERGGKLRKHYEKLKETTLVSFGCEGGSSPQKWLQIKVPRLFTKI